jgi:hypothetical protein
VCARGLLLHTRTTQHTHTTAKGKTQTKTIQQPQTKHHTQPTERRYQANVKQQIYTHARAHREMTTRRPSVRETLVLITGVCHLSSLLLTHTACLHIQCLLYLTYTHTLSLSLSLSLTHRQKFGEQPTLLCGSDCARPMGTFCQLVWFKLFIIHHNTLSTLNGSRTGPVWESLDSRTDLHARTC